MINKWGLTYAKANLQKFKNYGNRARPHYVLNIAQVFNKRLENAGVATTKSCRLPKANADQYNHCDSHNDFLTNKRAKVAEWKVLEAAASCATNIYHLLIIVCIYHHCIMYWHIPVHE